jgi:hypothetical protein
MLSESCCERIAELLGVAAAIDCLYFLNVYKGYYP